jgi:hypothetical protein
MKKLALLIILASSFSRSVFAGTDEWVGRAANAAGSLASGNYESAAYNAIPGANFQAGKQTQLYLNANSVGLRQPIIPYRQAGPLGYGANYNANTNFNLHNRPNFNQSANVDTGTKYFRNTSSFSPDYN